MFRSLFILLFLMIPTISKANFIDITQMALNSLGYNAGVEDGLYGRKTENALKKYYKDQEKEFDGVLDANELSDLQKSLKNIGLNLPGYLWKRNLGIEIENGDTTLGGWEQGWEGVDKKLIRKYEKANDITLFSIVNNKTRFGETAFYIQAPSDGCYNVETDCLRPNTERQKRVEAVAGDLFKGEVWVSYSLMIPEEFEMRSEQQSIFQFHSGYQFYAPHFQVTVGSKHGVVWKHESGNGFEIYPDGNHDCSAGSGSGLLKYKIYCPAQFDYYSLVKNDDIKRGIWYDFVFNINFNNDDISKAFHKVWLNGELVVERHNQTLWPVMPGVIERDVKVRVRFGLYGSKNLGGFHAVYADEIHKSNNCKDLRLDRLGYSCKSLINQKTKSVPSLSELAREVDEGQSMYQKPPKYDRSERSLKASFDCLRTALENSSGHVDSFPTEYEVAKFTANIQGDTRYRNKNHLVKLGLRKISIENHRKSLLRLVNFKDDIESFCLKPIR